MNDTTALVIALGLIATMYIASEIAWAYVARATLENDDHNDHPQEGDDQP